MYFCAVFKLMSRVDSKDGMFSTDEETPEEKEDYMFRFVNTVTANCLVDLPSDVSFNGRNVYYLTNFNIEGYLASDFFFFILGRLQNSSKD